MKKNIIGMGIVGFLLICVLSVIGYRAYGEKVYPLKYAEEIKKYAKEYDVDPFLVATLIRRQSGYRDIGYVKGEKSGLLEIREKTAQRWAKEIGIEDYKTEMVGDIEVNLRLGTWYLSKLQEKSSNIEEVLTGWCNRHKEEGVTMTKDEITIFNVKTLKYLKRYKLLYMFKLKI